MYILPPHLSLNFHVMGFRFERSSLMLCFKQFIFKETGLDKAKMRHIKPYQTLFTSERNATTIHTRDCQPSIIKVVIIIGNQLISNYKPS